VAAFTTVNLLSGPGDFVASINWGDGAITQGVITSRGGGQFTVSGTHTYANSGLVVVGVVIQSTEGVSTFATGSVEVTDRFVPIEGGAAGLPPGTVSSNNQPVFSGTAEAGDTVTLTAFRAGLNAPVVIGQAAVAADGTWNVTSSPLLDGAYSITAVATDFLGRPSSDTQLFASFTVDTVAPRITNVILNPKLGKVFITFQDDRSGLVESILADRANYALLRAGAAVPIRGITVSPGAGSEPRVVTLDVALGKAKGKAQKFTLAIAGSNFKDLGGNVLSEQFFLARPNSTKNGYIAQLISDGKTIAGPQSVQVNKAAKPKPSRFLRRGR